METLNEGMNEQAMGMIWSTLHMQYDCMYINTTPLQSLLDAGLISLTCRYIHSFIHTVEGKSDEPNDDYESSVGLMFRLHTQLDLDTKRVPLSCPLLNNG